MKYVSKNRFSKLMVWGFESKKHALNIDLCLNTQITLDAFIDVGPLSTNSLNYLFALHFIF